MTYRLKEHVGPNEDFVVGYRSIKEAEKWIKGDSMKRLSKLINSRVRQKIEEEVEKEIKEAFEFAEKSPFPNPEELYRNVFKENI